MIIQWLKDITLVIASCDKDDDENVTLADIEFKANSVHKVSIVDECATHIDIQFSDSSCSFDVDKNSYVTVHKLWEDFGTCTIDEEECIEKSWNGFEKGTHREEIWHWFEDTFNLSVCNRSNEDKMMDFYFPFTVLIFMWFIRKIESSELSTE